MVGSGKEAGHVFKHQKGNVEAVAEADKPRGFVRGVDVENTGQIRRLVRHNTDGATGQAAKAHNDVLGVSGMHFAKAAFVNNAVDDGFNVVGLLVVLGDDAIQRHAGFIAGGVGHAGRVFFAVLWNVAQYLLEVIEAGHIVGAGEMRHTAFGAVGRSTSKLFGAYLFVGHGFHYVRSGHEHVRAAFDHEDEIGQGRRVHSTAGARTHDGAELGHHTAGHNVAVEDVGVSAEGNDAFLNARTARIVEADYRRAVLHGEVHDLANFFGVCFSE